MARVPTWTELRLDAKKLAQIQKECYNSVHRLLDLDLPALDRKISMLSGKSLSSHESTPSLAEDNQEPYVDNTVFSASNYQSHYLTQDHHNTANKTLMVQPEEQLWEQNAAPIVEPVEYLPERREHDVIIPNSPPSTKPMEAERYCNPKSINLNENPHLQAPPLPLSEYLVRNRPEVVRRATRRALYVKTRADRRKFRNETKLINSFKRLRMASNHQPTDNSHSRNFKSAKTTSYIAPAYNVRYKLSEMEMKKLTARTYKRLPEVKMRHKEEVTNQMRALNHKNKLEYARKLTENRKNGIINYPLTSSYDDRSITSSQSEYSMNSYSGSADVHRW